MKKRASVFLLLVLFGTQLSIAAPKIKRGKKTESHKMQEAIDRIEKRVNEINKNIEDDKAAEIKLDELDEKYSQTMKDLRLE